ncbi:MAG TPA: ABC transporter permease [Nitrospiria bacterium]|nr:ABC transporter permease [Nitrospiria bacterium]
MGPLWAIMVKEFIEIRRDPRTLGLVVLMPVLLLILFGFAINLDIKQIRTAVCDRDRTPESRALAEAFFSSGYFKSVDAEARLPDGQACGREAELLDRGRASVYLEIPPRFGDRVRSGFPDSIQILLDGSDNNTASVAGGYVEQVLRGYSPDRLRAAAPRAAIGVESRVWFNPDLNSTIFITPGIVGLLIMIIGVALPAMAVVRERELGNLEVLLLSPARPWEVILGKMLPYGIISLVVIVLTVLTGVVVFHVPFRGSAIQLFGQTLVFLPATLGMGLLISTIARTRAVAFFISLISTLLPTFILSGFIFPVESMPWQLQGVSFLIPSTHFLIILRAILLKGVGAEAVWPHTLILLGFGLAVITISIRRFAAREEA